MGGNHITLDSRVSPLKTQRVNSYNESGLLGGVFPVSYSAAKAMSKVQSTGQPGEQQFETVGDLGGTTQASKNGELTISLRLQFLRNAHDYLVDYKEKL